MCRWGGFEEGGRAACRCRGWLRRSICCCADREQLRRWRCEQLLRVQQRGGDERVCLLRGELDALSHILCRDVLPAGTYSSGNAPRCPTRIGLRRSRYASRSPRQDGGHWGFTLCRLPSILLNGKHWCSDCIRERTGKLFTSPSSSRRAAFDDMRGVVTGRELVELSARRASDQAPSPPSQRTGVLYCMICMICMI